MSVLSDSQIGKELAYGELDVSPVNLSEQLQPNSLDIRLGDEFSLFLEDGPTIDPKEGIKEEHYTTFSDVEGYKVFPGDFVLATTIESFDIPDYLYGQLHGRSSVGRLGIEVHSTAGLLDSGYSGEVTLEIVNNNSSVIKLYPGMRIAQVVFHELSSPSSNPYNEKDNKYQQQKGAVHSRLNEEL